MQQLVGVDFTPVTLGGMQLGILPHNVEAILPCATQSDVVSSLLVLPSTNNNKFQVVNDEEDAEHAIRYPREHVCLIPLAIALHLL